MNIKDIAALANVSISTVSKVMNRKDQDISVATRRRVLEVIQEYQYVPYSKVRKNMSGRSHLLSVLIADDNAEYAGILSIIEENASKSGYSIVVYTLSGDKRTEDRQMKVMESRNVDGFLLLGDFHRRKELVGHICLEEKPCIVLGPDSSRKLEIPSVVYDESNMGFVAAKYLLEKQHVNIGCMFSGDTPMEDGYKKALYEAKIPFEDKKIFKGNACDEKERERFREWFSFNYTAVFCEDVKNTICLYQMLQECGAAIPDDVSVICGKDSSYLELLSPSVSSVSSVLPRLGQAAVEQLVGLIETKEEYKRPPEKIVFSVKERESTATLAEKYRGQKLVVVGSMNMDFTISVPHIPTDGETLVSEEAVLLPGGKGANQAVGASRLGGKVYLLGCLGNDGDGREIYNSLVTNKVHTKGIHFDGQHPTGKAYINVSDSNLGESTIVIYPGANRKLDSMQIQKHADLFDDAKYCLLSLEIPLETAGYAISLCRRKGIEIILKPSGVAKLEKQFIDQIAYFVPNKKELNQLVPGSGTIEEKAEKIWKMGAENVIVTLGKDGCYLKNEKYSRHFPAADFTPVDTTGGADAFISALAVYLSEGNSLIHAIGFSTYCAGLSVTRKGVQLAMPDRASVDMYQDMVFAQFQEK